MIFLPFGLCSQNMFHLASSKSWSDCLKTLHCSFQRASSTYKRRNCKFQLPRRNVVVDPFCFSWVYPNHEVRCVYCVCILCVRACSPERLSWRGATSSTQSEGNQPVRPLTVPSQKPPSPTLNTAGGRGEVHGQWNDAQSHRTQQRNDTETKRERTRK